MIHAMSPAGLRVQAQIRADEATDRPGLVTLRGALRELWDAIPDRAESYGAMRAYGDVAEGLRDLERILSAEIDGAEASEETDDEARRRLALETWR